MTASIEHIQVQANGITFHVAVAGRKDAPSILCLHGFPEGWMSWRFVSLEAPDQLALEINRPLQKLSFGSSRTGLSD